MRLDAGPMRDDEFASALAYARRGMLVTDHGATDAMDEALKRIAVEDPGPERDAAIEDARRLLAEERRSSPLP